MMKQFAPRILAGAGVLLLVVAGIHIVMTPELNYLFLRDNPGAAGRFWIAPFLLNHVVVGILLVPLGITTLIAASAARSGTGWARTIAITNALTVLTLPIAVCLIMGSAYFGALPFLIATILLAIAALLMLFAAISLPSSD
ncbi:MAG: hypothetical protein ACHQQQ_05870 [Bacteroidota bacterium]